VEVATKGCVLVYVQTSRKHVVVKVRWERKNEWVGERSSWAKKREEIMPKEACAPEGKKKC